MTELATDNAPTVTHTKVREARRTATLRHATYLTGSIPKLQPDSPVVQIHGLAQKVYPNSCLIRVVECVIHKPVALIVSRIHQSQKETVPSDERGFSDRLVA